MKRFWMRWEEPGEDYRPLTLPLPPAIKGWWCSSEGDSYATLCALVDADSEAAAKELVGQFWKPRAWSFCNEKDKDWLPGDRFPMEAHP